MPRRVRIPIEAQRRQIDRCEPRLALSASCAGDMLLEALGVGPANELDRLSSDGNEESGSAPTPLIDQASQWRSTDSLSGHGQTVAVIDSGVAWDHIALGGGYGPGYRVVGGWDFAEDDADPYDDGPAGFHGTHVAGLLAGDSPQMQGVAPGADIVALRVFDDHGLGQLQWIESALQWVHQNQDSFRWPVTTINLSIAANLTDANRLEAMTMLEDELELLRADNILVFAAAGNGFADGSAGVLYPASSSNVVAVSSTDQSGRLSDFAQREEGVLATLGESVRSSVPEHVHGWDGRHDDLASLDGTSMASPQVAAVSMLVREAMMRDGLEPTADEILDRVERTSTPQRDALSGHGYRIVDLDASVTGSSESGITDRFEDSVTSQHATLDLRDGITLTVNGVEYPVDANDNEVAIDVGAGEDQLRIIGSADAERLIARPPSTGEASSLWTNDFRIELRGFEAVIFEGGGGPDRASLFDTPGDDLLTSRPGEATLAGTGFRFEVNQVPRVYVHGSSGGSDTAILHDSSGDDVLAVRPQYTSLRNADSFQLAYEFERVYAYASTGDDSADLYDSAGDDTLNISPGRSILAGPGFQISARGFDSTTGHAIAGGHDVVRIYADQANSRWMTTSDRIQWTDASDTVRIARGFERSYAFEMFEPIELSPSSTSDPRSEHFGPPTALGAADEVEALRKLFADLGNS